MSVVKCSRSAFLATSSDRSGSWIGTSPRASDSTFACTMSRAKTSWPSSAKQAAVTRPTQPTPMTPMGSRSLMRRASLQRPRRLGDLEHLLLRERLEQRIRDPVGRLRRAPGDDAHAIPVEEELVLPSTALHGLRRRLEDGGFLPGGGLEPVELADPAAADDHAVGAIAVAVAALDRVDGGRALVERALGALDRVEDRVAHAAGRDNLEGLVLARGLGVLQPDLKVVQLLLLVLRLERSARAL